jgi:hypothetical protein
MFVRNTVWSRYKQQHALSLSLGVQKCGQGWMKILPSGGGAAFARLRSFLYTVFYSFFGSLDIVSQVISFAPS